MDLARYTPGCSIFNGKSLPTYLLGLGARHFTSPVLRQPQVLVQRHHLRLSRLRRLASSKPSLSSLSAYSWSSVVTFFDSAIFVALRKRPWSKPSLSIGPSSGP
jgi:hypothetical protein